jgi:osmotically inducible lipoprotein OsmB
MKALSMKTLTSLAISSAFLAAACSGMSETEQRTLSGAAIGAGAGTVVGAIAGNAGLGAVIGAGAGAAGGYLWDQHKQSEEENYQRGVADGQAQRQSTQSRPN